MTKSGEAATVLWPPLTTYKAWMRSCPPYRVHHSCKLQRFNLTVLTQGAFVSCIALRVTPREEGVLPEGAGATIGRVVVAILAVAASRARIIGEVHVRLFRSMLTKCGENSCCIELAGLAVHASSLTMRTQKRTGAIARRNSLSSNNKLEPLTMHGEVLFGGNLLANDLRTRLAL